MANQRDHVKAIVTAVIVALGCLCYIIAAATPQLYTYKILSIKAGFGLYMSCVDVSTQSTCVMSKADCSNSLNGNQSDYCNQYNAMRAFVLISVILCGISFICLVLYGVTRHLGSRGIAHICTLGASLTGIVTMGLAINFHDKLFSATDYGFSFALIIVGWILLLIIGTHMQLRK